MNRRRFLTGMAGILAAGYSASVLPSGVIMPIRKLWVPDNEWVVLDELPPIDKMMVMEFGRWEDVRYIESPPLAPVIERD